MNQSDLQFFRDKGFAVEINHWKRCNAIVLTHPREEAVRVRLRGREIADYAERLRNVDDAVRRLEAR